MTLINGARRRDARPMAKANGGEPSSSRRSGVSMCIRTQSVETEGRVT